MSAAAVAAGLLTSSAPAAATVPAPEPVAPEPVVVAPSVAARGVVAIDATVHYGVFNDVAEPGVPAAFGDAALSFVTAESGAATVTAGDVAVGEISGTEWVVAVASPATAAAVGDAPAAVAALTVGSTPQGTPVGEAFAVAPGSYEVQLYVAALAPGESTSVPPGIDTAPALLRVGPAGGAVTETVGGVELPPGSTVQVAAGTAVRNDGDQPASAAIVVLAAPTAGDFDELAAQLAAAGEPVDPVQAAREELAALTDPTAATEHGHEDGTLHLSHSLSLIASGQADEAFVAEFHAAVDALAPDGLTTMSGDELNTATGPAGLRRSSRVASSPTQALDDHWVASFSKAADLLEEASGVRPKFAAAWSPGGSDNPYAAAAAATSDVAPGLGGAWALLADKYPDVDCYVVVYRAGLTDHALGIAVHELFHCLHAAVSPRPGRETVHRAPEWVAEGLAEWARMDLVGPGPPTRWTGFRVHPFALFNSSYNAVHFWRLLDDGGSLWPLLPEIVENTAAFDNNSEHVLEWLLLLQYDQGLGVASAPVGDSSFGPRWTFADSLGAGRVPARFPIGLGSAGVLPVPPGVSVAIVADVALPDDSVLLVRMSGAGSVTVLGSDHEEDTVAGPDLQTWAYCVGTCICPDGSSPTNVELRPIPKEVTVAAAAIGALGGGDIQIGANSAESYCDEPAGDTGQLVGSWTATPEAAEFWLQGGGMVQGGDLYSSVVGSAVITFNADGSGSLQLNTAGTLAGDVPMDISSAGTASFTWSQEGDLVHLVPGSFEMVTDVGGQTITLNESDIPPEFRIPEARLQLGELTADRLVLMAEDGSVVPWMPSTWTRLS